MKITKHTSLKSIAEALRTDIDTAKKVRALVCKQLKTRTFASVQNWESYNTPSWPERVMCAMNELLGGHGTEPIRGESWDNFYGDSHADYVNMGDTYATTVLRDHHNGAFYITSWGDWMERNERRYGIA